MTAGELQRTLHVCTLHRYQTALQVPTRSGLDGTHLAPQSKHAFPFRPRQHQPSVLCSDFVQTLRSHVLTVFKMSFCSVISVQILCPCCVVKRSESLLSYPALGIYS